MPERRSHTKSRSGCTQCKLRRVKCDEQSPICGACRKRQAQCIYDPTQAKHSPHTDDGSSSPAINGHRSVAVDIRTHKAELELVYHWSTITHATVAFDAQQRIGTQHEITQTALQHDFLLDAVFAMTSLHLAFLRPHEAQVRIDDALRYQTRAVSASRRSLVNLSAAECVAHYQCSALLGICALALHCTDVQRVAREGPADALISIAQLWRGTGSIMEASHTLLSSELYQQMFPPLPAKVGVAESDPQTDACLDRLEDLAKMRDTGVPIFLEAIAGLREVFATPDPAANGYVYQVLKWAPQTPPQFFDMLYNHEPLACAVTMVYAVGFRMVESQWWLRGFSKGLVDELAANVMRLKPEWQDLVDWARLKTSVRQVEVDPNI